MSVHNFLQRPTHGTLRATLSDGNNRFLNRGSHNTSEDSIDSMTPQHQYNRSNGGYLQHRYNHPQAEHERRQKITINVSGERYQTYVETLNRFPDTLLGNPLKREEFYDDVEDEYFFDRDRSAFNAILYYYQSNGQLYCPLTVPMTILVTEAKFFDLKKEALTEVLDLHLEDKNKDMPKNKWQRKIWCLFEHPETSRTAHYFTLFSVLMILFSVTILCIETLPFAKKHIKDAEPTVSPAIKRSLHEYSLNISYKDKTIISMSNAEKLNQYRSTYPIYLSCKCKTTVMENNEQNMTEKFTKELEEVDWHEVFSTCEAVFVAWFTFEFIVRLTTSPNKIHFLKTILNIIDIVSILPFYITSALNRPEGVGLENFRVIRLVRVFRIFKLSRHSKGLQTLGKTLHASMKELGLMIFFLAIGVILFSSAVYYLEGDNFSSIPDAFWWAIITMCTVGYGDKVPKTFWGKVVGSACSICGVLSIALPVPVIVSNFDYFYNRERTKKIHQGFLEDSVEPVKTEDASVEVKSERDRGSPLLARKPTITRTGSLRSIKSTHEARTDEIHRQATLKDLEKRNRKLSQKLSDVSLFTPNRRNGHVSIDRETHM